VIIEITVVFRVIIDVGVPSDEGVVKVGFFDISTNDFISADV
jgi:hypothetical protein